MKKSLLFLTALMSSIVYCQRDDALWDWPNLHKYKMENATLNRNLDPTHTVVLMGDSITEFWKTTDLGFFNKTGYIDRGISGQTTSQMLLRFRQDVINLKPKVVVILAGINDIAENTGPITLEQIMGNIASMCELAKSNSINIVLCSVLPANTFPWRPDILPADKVIALNGMLKDYAQSHSIVYVDYYSEMVDDRKGLNAKWGDDGVHPNLAGYKVMEALLEPAVAKAQKK
ncbi:SGNH/GDSL hydrolase family protein [Flavobacterium sp.]